MSRTGLISSIIKQVASYNSQDSKLEVLQKYCNEKTLKRIVELAYNPWLDFKLQSFTPKYMGKEFGMGIARFLHIFDDIIQGKLEDNEASFAWRMAFMHVQNLEAEPLLMLVNQTLDKHLDLEIETINTVWPNLILPYPIRQAQPGSITGFDKFPASIQHISKGLRVNVIVKDKKVDIRTKDGIVVPGWETFHEQFLILAQGQDTVLDGHAMVVDSGTITDTDNQQVLDADPTKIKFTFWDAIRYDGFVDGKDTRIGYNWRYNGLEHMMMLSAANVTNPCYAMLRAEMVGSMEQLENTIKGYKNGYVLKELSGTWEQGPTLNEIIICD